MAMTRRTAIAGALGSAALAGCARAPLGGTTGATAPNTPSIYLMSYFSGSREAAERGLRLAASTDGLRYEPVAGGGVLLAPEVGESRLMRDPFLVHGPDGLWHLLWTTSWEGVTLGHATSPDLMNWSPQRAIPVMGSVEGTRNVWAPEMIWDERAGHWVIFWSSTVAGRFTETAGTSEDSYNHRLWYATTRDFVTLSQPQVLYDPGFSVIDGTFLQHPELGLHLIVKDETLVPERKHLRIARADSPTGPFGPLSPPISPAWVEGPAVAIVGEWIYVLYDRYREEAWGAVRSRDLVTWEDASALIAVPAGARHGTIVMAPASLGQTIG